MTEETYRSVDNVAAGTEDKKPREKTLVDLQHALEYYVKELRVHSAARNFLYKVFAGEVKPPTITLNAAGIDASINMCALNPEYAKGIIQILLEHEEYVALSMWASAHEITTEALELIEKMKVSDDATFSPQEQPAQSAKQEDDKEGKLNEIARGMLAEVTRGEPEGDQ
jgi:hypothetical protein